MSYHEQIVADRKREQTEENNLCAAGAIRRVPSQINGYKMESRTDDVGRLHGFTAYTAYDNEIYKMTPEGVNPQTGQVSYYRRTFQHTSDGMRMPGFATQGAEGVTLQLPIEVKVDSGNRIISAVFENEKAKERMTIERHSQTGQLRLRVEVPGTKHQATDTFMIEEIGSFGRIALKEGFLLDADTPDNKLITHAAAHRFCKTSLLSDLRPEFIQAYLGGSLMPTPLPEPSCTKNIARPSPPINRRGASVNSPGSSPMI